MGASYEEATYIPSLQIANHAEPANRNRDAPVAGHTVRPRSIGEGIGRPAVVLVVGQRKGAVAVGSEQTRARFGHSACSATARGESGEEQALCPKRARVCSLPTAPAPFL